MDISLIEIFIVSCSLLIFILIILIILRIYSFKFLQYSKYGYSSAKSFTRDRHNDFADLYLHLLQHLIIESTTLDEIHKKKIDDFFMSNKTYELKKNFLKLILSFQKKTKQGISSNAWNGKDYTISKEFINFVLEEIIADRTTYKK